MRFSPFEQRVFATATQALVDGPVEPKRVEVFLADLAARAPAHVAWGLKALLWLTWLAPLLIRARLCTLLGAAPAVRVAVWERALAHRVYGVRQLALVVKAMACLCHFDR